MKKNNELNYNLYMNTLLENIYLKKSLPWLLMCGFFIGGIHYTLQNWVYVWYFNWIVEPIFILSLLLFTLYVVKVVFGVQK